jgi:two-component system chemotaxis response regulator CheY
MQNSNPQNSLLNKLPARLISGTVLIVDDVSFYGSLVTQSLNLYGFVGTIVFAPSVHEAFKKIKEVLSSNGRIDLIISDLHLSDAKGSDLAKQIRENKETENIPFILMTTDSEKKNILNALDSGVDHFVIKPIVAEKLFSSILFAWKKRNPVQDKQ